MKKTINTFKLAGLYDEKNITPAPKLDPEEEEDVLKRCNRQSLELDDPYQVPPESRDLIESEDDGIYLESELDDLFSNLIDNNNCYECSDRE